jgi:hypothetical protein
MSRGARTATKAKASACATAWNVMHGRAMRTSWSSMPTTVTSATAALARATALLEQAYVGGAELHRTHRTQPASSRVADTCYSRLNAPALYIHAARSMGRASKAPLALQERRPDLLAF